MNEMETKYFKGNQITANSITPVGNFYHNLDLGIKF